MNAMRVWPRLTRCSTARAPPRTSSTATEEMSSTGDVVSSRTTSMPRSRRASRASSEPADGVTMTPCTPCSSNSRRYRASRSGSSSDELSMSVYSSAASRSSTPRATSVKNGLAMSSTMAPTVWMVPARSCRAEALRTNCSSSMATSTRSRVFVADLVGAVEHVGDGADRHPGPLGDVRDGGSAVCASPCRRRHRPSSSPSEPIERAPDGSCPRDGRRGCLAAPRLLWLPGRARTVQDSESIHRAQGRSPADALAAPTLDTSVNAYIECMNRFNVDTRKVGA